MTNKNTKNFQADTANAHNAQRQKLSTLFRGAVIETLIVSAITATALTCQITKDQENKTKGSEVNSAFESIARLKETMQQTTSYINTKRIVGANCTTEDYLNNEEHLTSFHKFNKDSCIWEYEEDDYLAEYCNLTGICPETEASSETPQNNTQIPTAL